MNKPIIVLTQEKINEKEEPSLRYQFTCGQFHPIWLTYDVCSDSIRSYR